MRPINIDALDSISVRNAIMDLETYRDRMDDRALEVRERMADIIAKHVRMAYTTVVVDDTTDGPITGASATVEVESDSTTTTITVDGEDVIFIEFGAGVYHNGGVGSSPNPWGAKLNYTIGSYSKSHPEKEIWIFSDFYKVKHWTHGTPASMPLYKAFMSALGQLQEIAR